VHTQVDRRAGGGRACVQADPSGSRELQQARILALALLLGDRQTARHLREIEKR